MNVFVLSTPAHKQTDPSKTPAQRVNPIPRASCTSPRTGGYPGK